MTTFFVSRHPGALTWIKRQQVPFDVHIQHLELDKIHAGDTVIGSLPVNLAAEVCAKGATYQHLSLALAAQDRGRELSAEELERCEAHLTTYEIKEKS